MTTLADATWQDIEGMRSRITAGSWGSMEAAAQEFTSAFSSLFSDLVLSRLFVLTRLESLPVADRAFAARLARGKALADDTRVLSLLGTTGREASWNDRRASAGHLCIPLLDRASVEAAPMVAKLLADIDVDLAAFDDGRPIATRKMIGGKNGMFYVPDASTAVDAQGRHIIADRAFVAKHAIRTVFGMGGAYLDGTLVTAIFFSTIAVDRVLVDRLPSLIINFKMATAALAEKRRLFQQQD